jgi:hypothetical protein
MDTTLVGTLSKAGAIHKVVGGYVGLPSMNEPGTVAALGDSLQPRRLRHERRLLRTEGLRTPGVHLHL